MVVVNPLDEPRFANIRLAAETTDQGGILHGRVGERDWQVPRDAVKQVISIPDLHGDFTSREQFVSAAASLDELSRLVESRPHLRETLLPIGTELKTIVDSGAEGLVRVDGEWQEGAKMEKTPTAETAPTTTEVWQPESIDDVASCCLFVKIDKVTQEGERGFGGGSAFLCNIDGVTYVYSNVHNFDGTMDFAVFDQQGRRYSDFVSVEVAAEGQGYHRGLGWGGDVIRLRLPDYHPRALTLSDQPVSDADVGKSIVVTGNTKDRDKITRLTGKITGINPDHIIETNAKAQAGNSGSPIVDLETFQVIGIFTWGAYDDEDPLFALWSKQSDEMRQGLGSGPDITRMTFEPSSLEALFRHRVIFNQLKENTRLLGLLDTLYPRKEGVFVDTEQIVMGDYTVIDLLRESPEHFIVNELTELHERLKQKAESNVGISNQDMFKGYISAYKYSLEHVRRFRRKLQAASPPTFYMQCNFENSHILEICEAYEMVIYESLEFYDAQSSTHAEVWPIAKRIRLPAFRSGIDGLLSITERK